MPEDLEEIVQDYGRPHFKEEVLLVNSELFALAQHEEGGPWAVYSWDGSLKFGGPLPLMIKRSFVKLGEAHYLHLKLDGDESIIDVDGNYLFGSPHHQVSKTGFISLGKDYYLHLRRDGEESIVDVDGNYLFGSPHKKICSGIIPAAWGIPYVIVETGCGETLFDIEGNNFLKANYRRIFGIRYDEDENIYVIAKRWECSGLGVYKNGEEVAVFDETYASMYEDSGLKITGNHAGVYKDIGLKIIGNHYFFDDGKKLYSVEGFFGGNPESLKFDDYFILRAEHDDFFRRIDSLRSKGSINNIPLIPIESVKYLMEDNRLEQYASTMTIDPVELFTKLCPLIAEDVSALKSWVRIMSMLNANQKETMDIDASVSAALHFKDKLDDMETLQMLKHNFSEERAEVDFNKLIEYSRISVHDYVILERMGGGAIKKAYLARSRLEPSIRRVLLMIDPTSGGFEHYRLRHPKDSDDEIMRILMNDEFSATKISEKLTTCLYVSRVEAPTQGKIDDRTVYIIPTIPYDMTLDDFMGFAAEVENLHKNMEFHRKKIEFFWQICVGLYECHKKGIVHKDLKPDNIGIVLREEDQHIVLADFGCASVFSTHADARYQYPLLLRPPELAFDAEEKSKDVSLLDRDLFTPEANAWTAGAIFYFMMTGNHLFDKGGVRKPRGTEEWKAQNRKVYDQIRSFRPAYLEQMLPANMALHRGILEGLLKPEPAKREGALKKTADFIEQRMSDILREASEEFYTKIP